MATACGFCDCRAHQARTNALAFMGRIDRKRAEQQRIYGHAIPANTGFNVP